MARRNSGSALAWQPDTDLASQARMCAAMLRTLADEWGLRVRNGKLGPHQLADVHGFVGALESAAGVLEPTVPKRDDPVYEEVRALLRDSEERLRLLIDGVNDHAIFMLDPLGHIVSWNAGAQRIKGWTAEEAIGRHFSMFYPEDVVASGHPARELETATRAGRYEEEGWRLRKDGTRFWASVVITALRDGSGQLRGFAKVTRDLTERREALERFRRGEERYRLMIEGVRDYAIFMLDPSGNVATWNLGAERIKGWRAEEVVGRHFSVFYPPDVAASGHPQAELAIAMAEERFEEEGWRVRKDGTRFWASVTITAVRSEAGELLGFSKVTRDMTDRKNAEDRLRAIAVELADKTRLLEEKNSELDAFAAMIAHDLRSPLRVIDGYATILVDRERDRLSQPGVRQLARVRESAQRMVRMVEDLLRFSRAGVGGTARRWVEVSELAERIAAEVAVVVTSPSPVTFTCEPGIVMYADPVLLATLVTNLLENAWKFTRGSARPTVTMGRAEEEGMKGFFVRDNGVGFEPGAAAGIFTPFSRLRPEYEGTGIGLATVQRIVARHQGIVRAEGVPDKGATFYVCFPVSQPGTGGSP